MKIATFNVNGINSRLPALLQWLEASAPDVACPILFGITRATRLDAMRACASTIYCRVRPSQDA